ncbi:MAG: DNA translocase FtsK [Lachnospiraceae bacterium]|nr:DNA translocase FtsK [Lachnospiraceae bacterium]
MAKQTRGRKPQSTGRKKSYKRTKKDYELIQDIKIILIVALAVFFFVCNFGVIGKVGDVISSFGFGLFGVLNYVVALFIAFLIVIYELSAGSGAVVRKIVASSVFFLLIDMIIDFIGGITKTLEKYNFIEMYKYSTEKRGGGVIAASLVFGLKKAIKPVGTIIVILVLLIICLVILTEKSFVRAVKDTTEVMLERTREDRAFKEELKEDRRKAYELKKEERLKELERRNQERAQALEKKEQKINQKSDEEVLKRNKKVTGVTFNTLIEEPANVEKQADVSKKRNKNDDIHEITLNGFEPSTLTFDVSSVPINSSVGNVPEEEDEEIPGTFTDLSIEEMSPSIVKPARPVKKAEAEAPSFDIGKEIKNEENDIEKREYIFPPRTLLNKGTKKAGDSTQSIRQTAQKLQDTLAIFGVEATVTDISQGPTVTRFELQPKLGVKVSRIKNLSDDIKLNLAASEIRIEAPIPGKAAIGIEVPNKEAQPVVFRDLIDTPEYNNFDSNLAFAVGKDIAGKTIVYGIDNFPHLLIAGATGSGKSVCINTLIMSIIYKANPDDVKLIMIDPKVVELSVYNGIPHLLLPVVTDVKKASATLAYAVNEMHERYKKFSEVGVREISGYNREIEKNGEDSFNQKMPHIVIIVDEVADLMLQERKNVEDSICSLAQLARAAGIHLIIATQRPSVDVITGIIKANMPSRIAFAVSSNVDSRTILDMGGAEELLGKGDMLFFPKGLKKPVRLQGGFISDKEVNSVVEFLKKQGSPSYDAMIEEKIRSCEKSSDSSGGSGAMGDGGDGNDEMFVEAGFYIIDSDKASIGMLQRKFKMGFNRAARVMDQLADAGVVGPDLGTKPREILMSHEQFENYLEEYGG